MTAEKWFTFFVLRKMDYNENTTDSFLLYTRKVNGVSMKEILVIVSEMLMIVAVSYGNHTLAAPSVELVKLRRRE